MPNQISYSEEVSEIMNYRPNWIIRKGNIFLMAVVLLLMCISWVVRYPDVIAAPIRITAQHSPKQVVANTQGKIKRLLVDNEQPVAEGQYLAFIESTANHEEVLELKRLIDTIENDINKAGFQIPASIALNLHNLGDIQPAYQEFQTASIELKEMVGNGYYSKKKESIRRDIGYLQAVSQNTKRQKAIAEQDYELQRKEYQAKEMLMKEKIIAPLEFNEEKSKMLSKEQGLNQLNAQMINNSLAEKSKEKELLELDKLINDQLQKFHSSLLNLKNRITEWQRQYILIAPETGTVVFVTSLQANQLLAAGQQVFYIQQPVSASYGEVMAGQKGIGKVFTGQQVIIRIDGYPSAEFGFVKGKISHISALPNMRDSFLIKVELPEGLNTNYNKQLSFKNNLSGTADIITENKTLLSRFFGSFRQVLKNN